MVDTYSFRSCSIPSGSIRFRSTISTIALPTITPSAPAGYMLVPVPDLRSQTRLRAGAGYACGPVDEINCRTRNLVTNPGHPEHRDKIQVPASLCNNLFDPYIRCRLGDQEDGIDIGTVGQSCRPLLTLRWACRRSGFRRLLYHALHGRTGRSRDDRRCYNT